MPLKIDQIPLSFTALLDTLPPDLLYTTTEIMEKLGTSEASVRRKKKNCPGRFIKIGSLNYWGNPKAIAAYIKKYGV